MPTVRVAQKRIWVGEESRALLHGEAHYWRLAPARWRDVLRALKSLGLDIVSSYVCWDFHEVEPGLFDFSGETDAQRNLLGFLNLCQDEGLWVVLRPGPYIYAEWRNSGIPDRVVEYHRAQAEFRREAERYLEAVVEAFRPYLATHGGPVVLVQPDNEPDAWADVYGRQLGLAEQRGPFQAFLRERYGSLEALNAAWGKHYARFEDARAVQAPLSASTEVPYLDTVRFLHAHADDITRWTAGVLRRCGVDVPLYANTYSGFGVQNWRSMQESVDFVGPDVYPTAELRAEPAEHRRMLERLRFTRTYAPLPYIPEFESGIWHGWHERVGALGPNHYRLICLSALLAGVAGWGWYMLANRDNWYMSPIDELGRARPDLAGEFASIVRVFRALDPPSLEKVTDTAVAVDVLALGARVHGPPGEALLEALYRADVDYECFDVETGRLARRLLVHAGADWLSMSAQQRLLDYVVEDGGILVFTQAWPVRDEHLRPLNLLGLRAPDGVLRDDHRRPLALLGAECLSPVTGWYAETPGEPIVAERLPERGGEQQGLDWHARVPVGQRITVGYREQRGRGSIVCLAVQPSAELVLGVHRWLEVPIASRATTPHVSTALFRATGGGHVLIAVNNGDEDRVASIELSRQADTATDLFSGDCWPVGGSLGVRLPRKSGTALRLD
jgi:hypothetical protein